MLCSLEAFRDQVEVRKHALVHPAGGDERQLDAVEWSWRKYGYGEQLKTLASEIKRHRVPGPPRGRAAQQHPDPQPAAHPDSIVVLLRRTAPP